MSAQHNDMSTREVKACSAHCFVSVAHCSARKWLYIGNKLMMHHIHEIPWLVEEASRLVRTFNDGSRIHSSFFHFAL